jgi:hypothetical protein
MDIVVRAVEFESYFVWRLILSTIENVATNVLLLGKITPPLNLPLPRRNLFYLSCEYQRDLSRTPCLCYLTQWFRVRCPGRVHLSRMGYLIRNSARTSNLHESSMIVVQ